MPASEPPTTTDRTHAAGPVRGTPLLNWVAAGVAIEALCLLIGAVLLVMEAIRGKGSVLAADVALAVVAAAMGLGLGWLAWAVHRARRWSRGPILTWQLLMGFTLASMLGGSHGWLAGLLIALAVAVGGALLTGRAARALGADPGQEIH